MEDDSPWDHNPQRQKKPTRIITHKTVAHRNHQPMEMQCSAARGSQLRIWGAIVPLDPGIWQKGTQPYAPGSGHVGISYLRH